MKPYNQIFVGDIYNSQFRWTGSDMTWEVVSKK